MKCC